AQSSSASAVTKSVDTTAPSTPTGLSGTAVSQSQINLSWFASTDAVGVTGYRVYKTGAHIGTVTTGTTYSDTLLTAATSYSYTVAAYDAAGNVSAQSGTVSVTTQALSVITTSSTPTSDTADTSTLTITDLTPTEFDIITSTLDATTPVVSETSTVTSTVTSTTVPTTTTVATFSCAGNYLLCNSEQSCKSAGFYWYTVSCHPTAPPVNSCAASYDYCVNGPECSTHGYYWCRNDCYGVVEACLGETYIPPAVFVQPIAAPSTVVTTTPQNGIAVLLEPFTTLLSGLTEVQQPIFNNIQVPVQQTLTVTVPQTTVQQPTAPKKLTIKKLVIPVISKVTKAPKKAIAPTVTVTTPTRTTAPSQQTVTKKPKPVTTPVKPPLTITPPTVPQFPPLPDFTSEPEESFPPSENFETDTREEEERSSLREPAQNLLSPFGNIPSPDNLGPRLTVGQGTRSVTPTVTVPRSQDTLRALPQTPTPTIQRAPRTPIEIIRVNIQPQVKQPQGEGVASQTRTGVVVPTVGIPTQVKQQQQEEAARESSPAPVKIVTITPTIRQRVAPPTTSSQIRTVAVNNEGRTPMPPQPSRTVPQIGTPVTVKPAVTVPTARTPIQQPINQPLRTPAIIQPFRAVTPRTEIEPRQVVAIGGKRVSPTAAEERRTQETQSVQAPTVRQAVEKTETPTRTAVVKLTPRIREVPRVAITPPVVSQQGSLLPKTQTTVTKPALSPQEFSTSTDENVPPQTTTQQVTVPLRPRTVSQTDIAPVTPRATDVTAVCPYVFTRNLGLGASGEDVRKFQQLLNSDRDTVIATSGIGSPGNESTFFGVATFNALIRFQNKYVDEVLAPAGFTEGTGFFGSLSRQKANTICR
ncbi:MAG: hypothetical protein Q8R36_02015, partial [bacterium]|nr:hypothetical protein [bacterium]